MDFENLDEKRVETRWQEETIKLKILQITLYLLSTCTSFLHEVCLDTELQS